MASSFFGPGGFGASPFDEFLSRFFGDTEQRRPTQRVDITRLMSDQAQELVASAARQAAEWGSPDLDSEHLLWAATRGEPTRQMLSGAGAEPDGLARDIEDKSRRGAPER